MAQEWTPQSKTAKTVFEVGFSYDPVQNIIFSRMDAWQRKFGCAYAYDLAAPATISAIIDCEPIFFSHGGKDWMIELRKGQYGLETGGEIGVYVAKQSDDRSLLDKILGNRPHDRDNGKFFDCADDDERLTMSFTMKRKGVPLFKRGPEMHWWLTGFMWGVLSDPTDLEMEVTIDFPSADMTALFVDALRKTGYGNVDARWKSVSFVFNRPFTCQPRTDSGCGVMVKRAEKDNSVIVEKYNGYGLPNNDPNEMDGDVKEVLRYFERRTSQMIEKTLVGAMKEWGVNPADARKALSEVRARSAGMIARTFRGLRKMLRWIRK